jgi:hypothetical protein
VNADGDMITTSIFWPKVAGVPQPDLDFSKQICVTIYEILSHYGFAEVSQYPGTLPNGSERRLRRRQNRGRSTCRGPGFLTAA